jgi:hypothetical protein
MNEEKRETKNCPFCGEKIYREAIKCRYCSEFLHDANIPEKPFVQQAADVSVSKIVETEQGSSTLPDMKLGFGWGNVWITFSFFYGAMFLLSATANYAQGDYVMAVGLLIVSLWAIGSAVGLLTRRKIGLHLTYASLALGLVGGGYEAIEKSFQYQELEIRIFLLLFGSAVLVIVELLWFRYFRARGSWFK